MILLAKYVFYIAILVAGASLASAQGSYTDLHPGEFSKEIINVEAHLNALYLDDYANSLYRHGSGDPKNFEAAFLAYQVAAEYGIPHAQFYYARMYQYGRGCKLNYDLAWDWYNRAAQSGDRRAWNNMGHMLENGQGRDKQPDRSLLYYLEASKRGMAMGSYNIANHYQYGDGENYRDYSKAVSFYNLTLEQYEKYPKAYNNLGLIYLNGGYGIEKSPSLALDFFKKAIDLKDGYAAINIGRMYRDGALGMQNPHLAAAHFKLATDLGRPEGWNFLGSLYYEEGPLENEEKALENYLKAYEQGLTNYLYRIGWIYKNGPTALRNEANAFKFLTLAAMEGSPSGIRSLGYCYAYGIGTEHDRDRAEELWLDCGGNEDIIQ